MIRNLAIALVSRVARKSRDVKMQAFLCFLHGAISIFGFRGAFAIVMKLRKVKHL